MSNLLIRIIQITIVINQKYQIIYLKALYLQSNSPTVKFLPICELEHVTDSHFVYSELLKFTCVSVAKYY